MGFFSQIDDNDAELLVGGAKPDVNSSTQYDGSNYGQFKKYNEGEVLNPGKYDS